MARARARALREGDRAWTYDELADRSRGCRRRCAGCKLGRGERVLILMRDTLEAAAAILGAIHAGAVAVPVSELATPDDVQEYVLHAGAVDRDRRRRRTRTCSTRSAPRRPTCAR